MNNKNLYQKQKNPLEPSIVFGDVELNNIKDSTKHTETLLTINQEETAHQETEILGKEKTPSQFILFIVLTLFIYAISYIPLIIIMITVAEIYNSIPGPFDNFVNFFQFKIFLLILAFIKIAIGLIFIFLQFFFRVNWIISLIFYFLFVISNIIFGSFVGLYLVNRDNPLWRVPIYSIIGVMTLIYLITLVINAIIAWVGKKSQFGISISMQLKNGSGLFRIILFLFSLIIIFGSFKFDTYKSPTWFILAMMGILLFLLFMVVNMELFDIDRFYLEGSNTFSKSINLAFYLFVISTDIIYLWIAFLPAIGLPNLANTAIPGVSTSSKVENTEIKGKFPDTKVKKVVKQIKYIFF